MLNPKIINQISKTKHEPNWMSKIRLKALDIFNQKPMPSGILGLDLNKINYFSSKIDKAKSWKDLPKEIRSVYQKLGIPEDEQRFLAGVEAQWDSDPIYGAIKESLERQGVIFTDTDTALKKHPRIFRKYFGKLIPSTDNKFAALNTACWSGGSFVFVPKNVKVPWPLQAYFRINARSFGQFERTLIIAEEGSEVTYVEGCSAPVYAESSLHAGVVEIFVQKNACVKYITVQNWSQNIFNLVTKRSQVEESGKMRWLDVNLGSKMTMKYPSCYLIGQKARGEMVSLSIAKGDQIQDTGAKMFHLAPNTSSEIFSKSVCLKGGKSVFRGQVVIKHKKCRSKTKCESLILDDKSTAESFPNLKVEVADAQASHEAKISRLEEEQLFYLQTRGLTRQQAESLLVTGFTKKVINELPMEYAVEINELIPLELGGHAKRLSHFKTTAHLF